MTPPLEIKRAAERFVTSDGGVVARHSFSFGAHYDPANVGFGLLAVSNDDLIWPGAGYPVHQHRDVEIVTWVLDGSLVHRDSMGVEGVIIPGLAQRMSAGRGVTHSEVNEAPGGSAALRFVQMWVPPDESGGDPRYAQCDVGDELVAGDLLVVASGMRRHPDVGVSLGQAAAAMHVGRPAAGAALTLPAAPFVHVFVARGGIEIEGLCRRADEVEAGDAGEPVRLGEGDAVRLTDEEGRVVRVVSDAELIIWEMHADLLPR